MRARLVRAVLPVAGAVIGLLVALASPHRGSPQWVVWAALAVALATTSGAVAGYGLARWPEITALGPVGTGRVVRFVGRLVLIGAGFVTAGVVVMRSQSDDPFTGRGTDLSGSVLTLLAAAGAVPVGAAFGAIRERARAVPGAPGEQVEALLVLQRLLSGLLAAFGSLVALATLALGAALRQVPHPELAIVVIFGGAWSVIVACAYTPAATAVRDAARALARGVVPLAGVAADDLPARAEERRRLEQALGVDRGVLADIQSGLIIFAPLAASATAAFLPG